MRRRLLVLALGCATVASGVMLLIPADREPRYNGTKLSQWLEMYGRGKPNQRREAAQAVRQIGTNSLPWLLKWLPFEMTSWKRKLVTPMNKLPLPARYKVAVFRWAAPTGRPFAQALWGFEILGSEASPAIPELARLTGDPTNAQPAMFALAKIGEEALPALLTCFINPRATHRVEALNCILQAQWSGKDMASAVPVLVQCLGDQDAIVAAAAASGLASFKAQANTVVPALANSLKDRRASVRSAAAGSLGGFEVYASSATAELLAALNDSDDHVRGAATNALRRIAPEMLEKASAH